MDKYKIAERTLTNDENEIRNEIDNALATLRSGRNYRDYSEETIDTLYPHIYNILEDDLIGQLDEMNEDDENFGRMIVDVDMVITAMMMELSGTV